MLSKCRTFKILPHSVKSSQSQAYSALTCVSTARSLCGPEYPQKHSSVHQDEGDSKCSEILDKRIGYASSGMASVEFTQGIPRPGTCLGQGSVKGSWEKPKPMKIPLHESHLSTSSAISAISTTA